MDPTAIFVTSISVAVALNHRVVLMKPVVVTNVVVLVVVVRVEGVVVVNVVDCERVGSVVASAISWQHPYWAISISRWIPPLHHYWDE